MPWTPRKLGFTLLACAAAGAYAVVVGLPGLVENYHRLADRHPALGRTYLAAAAAVVGLLAAGAAALAARLWRASRRKRQARLRRQRHPSDLTPAELQAELADNLAAGAELADDAATAAALRAELRAQLAALQQKQQRQQLEIVAFGAISSGKSSLLNTLAGRDAFASSVLGGTTAQRCEIPWPGHDRVTLVDTPGLAEVGGAQRAAEAAAAAGDADLVLLVIDGPLKAYEVALAESLLAMEKRILVCLNKQDWYEPPALRRLLDQVAEQLPGIPREDMVAVRSRPTVRPVVRVGADGRQTHEEALVPPDVSALAERMLAAIDREGHELLLANLLLQSRGLVDEARQRVRAELDRRAEEIIHRHMWAAGGAAGVNPFPLLDLAGGSAITLKMALDLARVYQQPLDTEMAVELLQQLSKNLVAMLGASAATPAVASLLASLLKTAPGVGTIAGGLLQGLVQALVTRWIGNVFLDYLRNDMRPPASGLAETARRHWQQLTTVDALRRLIQEGRQRLGGRHD